LIDSCLYKNDMARLQEDAQQQRFDYSKYNTLNMLNCKYIVYGEQAGQVIVNQGAAGPVWFVKDLVSVNSPNEELEKVNEIDTRTTAIIDISKFKAPVFQYDSMSTILNVEHNLRNLKYESQARTPGLAVFSEIYYPEGWIATIDGKETPILRVNYVLRAVEVPAGKHTIEFKFEPRAFILGNKVTAACSWLVLLVLLGSIGWSLKKEN
jgi:Bacterial membrane protein YfhO